MIIHIVNVVHKLYYRNIGYSQFFQEIQSAIKYEQPNASFHDICQLVDERWNQLSKIEKKVSHTEC